MDLRSSITVTAGMPVVSFDGSVDLATVAQLRDRLLRTVVEHPGQRIVVDLDGVDVLDDAGLGILLGSAGRAREQQGDIVVVVTAPSLRRRFAASGFDRAVELFASIAAATTATATATALFHIAEPGDLAAVPDDGEYTTSTRGRSLDEEGFIHCSFAHQVDATLARFYCDLDEVTVLRIDTARVQRVLVVEDLVGSGEPYPHLYGPLPMSAVIGREVRQPR